jgi:hypothetical protein
MGTYTREHLEIVYKAGQAKIPLEDVLHVLNYLETEAAKRDSGTDLGAETRRRVRKGRRSRTVLSPAITGYLSRQGSKGAHVSEIAKALRIEKANVVAWFYGTGKKHIKSGEIKKTGPNTFAYVMQGKVQRTG